MKIVLLFIPFLLGMDSPNIYKKQYIYFESDFLDEHVEIFKYDQKIIVWHVYITPKCKDEKKKVVRALDYHMPITETECKLKQEATGIFIFSMPKEEIRYAEFRLDIRKFLEWEKNQRKKFRRNNEG